MRRNRSRWARGPAVVAVLGFWLLTAALAPAQTRERLLRQAEQAYHQKQYSAGSDLYLRLMGKEERDFNVYYNAACCLALDGRADRAFRFLGLAVDYGWQNANHLSADPDLRSLHDDPRWAKLREKLATQLAQADARRPFKTALGIDLGLEKSEYFPFSEYRRLDLEGKARPGKSGTTLGSGKWYELKAKPDGWIFNTLGTVVQADWDEPRERTALLHAHPRKFITINGEQHFGGQGFRHLLPVRLKQGKNRIVCDHQLIAQLYPAEFPFSFVKGDPGKWWEDSLIAPDIRLGESGDFDASVTVINATDKPSSVTISARFGDGPETRTASKIIPAMNSRITRFRFRVAGGQKPGEQSLQLSLSDGGERMTASLQVVGRDEVCYRTFVSRFDGLVRRYALNPSSTETAGQAVILAFPGGGWEAKRTARSYVQRPWCHFVCPQLHGGNGEGVSRQAALEVLEHSIREVRADPKQVLLIGYSAGGHAAWQIASLNPGLFSGVGASAGWISYFSYDMRPRPIIADPISRMLARAVTEIDVESRFHAIASIGNIALVHGDKDRSVPVSESRRINQEMEKRGVTPFYQEQRGADHAWATESADQVDFPPLLEHLRKHARVGTGDLWAGVSLPRTWHDLLKRPLAAIYGTNGSAQENEAARNAAMMQMECCRIIYGVDCEVLPDTTLLANLQGRSVLLYGSPASNGLWGAHPTAGKLLEAPSARQATSWLILGERDGALWGAIGGKTLIDCRIAYTLDPTSSLYPFPDWVLLTREVLDKDSRGLIGVGWFGPDGKIDREHSAFRAAEP